MTTPLELGFPKFPGNFSMITVIKNVTVLRAHCQNWLQEELFVALILRNDLYCRQEKLLKVDIL